MKISVCVITKNEEKNILRCLDSVKGIGFEMIVVDTGSTDETVNLARKYGAKVYSIEWKNDFAAARNFAISKAKGDWIIFLDADEYLASDSIDSTYNTIIQCHANSIDFIYGLLTNIDGIQNRLINSVPVIRIFRKASTIKYSGTIHEIVVRTDREPKKFDATSLIKIIHTGYTSNIERQKIKGNRNLDLLLVELEKKPRSSDVCYYIAEAYMMIGNFNEALNYAHKVIEYNNAELFGAYQKNYLNIISCMITLKYSKELIKKIILEALNKFPEFPDFYMFLGDTFTQEGRYHDAISSYKKGLDCSTNIFSSQSSTHINLVKILFNIGDLYFKIDDYGESVKYFIEALKTDKFHYNSLLSLIKIFTKSESTENIIRFFEKIYNYGKTKDTLILLKATLQVRNVDLAEYYMTLPQINSLVNLRKENALLSLLKGEYIKAFEEYKTLYLKEYKNEYAIKLLTSCILLKDPNKLEKISLILKPSLKRIAQYILGKELAINSLDREDLLNILKELFKFKCFNNTPLKNIDYNDLKLELQLAETAFEIENFQLSIDYYQKYIEGKLVSNSELSYIISKVASAYYKVGQYELALQKLKDSLELNPLNYRNYELAIHICFMIEDVESRKYFTTRARQYFSDSFYINELTKKVKI